MVLFTGLLERAKLVYGRKRSIVVSEEGYEETFWGDVHILYLD